mmetsp:Transcript_22907/g.55146  ORF Transcript_22907/g.55146 Transcript_22907/m.55146 type:complete len:232 (-) Transcript_22907:530-1225(-)
MDSVSSAGTMYLTSSPPGMRTKKLKCSINWSSAGCCPLYLGSLHRYLSSLWCSIPLHVSSSHSLSALRTASLSTSKRWISKLRMMRETPSMSHCGSHTTSSRSLGRSNQSTAPSACRNPSITSTSRSRDTLAGMCGSPQRPATSSSSARGRCGRGGCALESLLNWSYTAIQPGGTRRFIDGSARAVLSIATIKARMVASPSMPALFSTPKKASSSLSFRTSLSKAGQPLSS